MRPARTLKPNLRKRHLPKASAQLDDTTSSGSSTPNDSVSHSTRGYIVVDSAPRQDRAMTPIPPTQSHFRRRLSSTFVIIGVIVLFSGLLINPWSGRIYRSINYSDVMWIY